MKIRSIERYPIRLKPVKVGYRSKDLWFEDTPFNGGITLKNDKANLYTIMAPTPGRIFRTS